MLLFGSSFLFHVMAADGDLDGAFGVGGKLSTDFFSASDIGNDVTVQLDGKIIVPGRVVTSSGDADFGLARYNSDGTPDAGFGNGGQVTTDFNGFSDSCFAVAVQTDDRIVAVGGAFSSDDSDANDFAMCRYNSDGTLDATFGNLGTVTFDFGSGVNDEGLDVVIQGDGKIVVAVGQAVDSASDFILARFNSDGTFDGTFGAGGVVSTDFFGDSDVVGAIALQPDGKIVAAGDVTIVGDDDFGLARYNSDGGLDATFGTGGKVTTDFFADADGANSVALQSDGKIVAAGSSFVSLSNSLDFAIARYNSDGTPDDGFGVGGKVTTDFSPNVDSGAEVAVQCDGKIVVAGTANSATDASDMAVARYQSDGTLDAGFGVGGKVVTDFAGRDTCHGLALQNDGRIIVAGSTRPGDQSTLDFALARYDGTPCAAAPCPLPHGFWKNNPASWPVDSLMLGSQSYTKNELLALLKTSTQTDASIILARQLIAARLNIENGSDATPVSPTIIDADALLSSFSGKLPYKVKPSSSTGGAMTAYAAVLHDYNNGLLTPGCSQ
jgi:uncharacterized delta-60 repeat protein